MKTKLLSLILASFALVSIVEAKFFLGVDAGYTAKGLPENTPSSNSLSFKGVKFNTISNAFKNNPEGFAVGINLGTEHFFGRYFGLRWLAGVGYSSVLTYVGGSFDAFSKARMNAITSNLAFDLMVNFFNNGNMSFGIFGGIGANHEYGLDTKENSLGLVGRVGLSTLIARHNRFEIFASLPVADFALMNGAEWKIKPLNDVFVGASYKYVF